MSGPNPKPISDEGSPVSEHSGGTRGNNQPRKQILYSAPVYSHLGEYRDAPHARHDSPSLVFVCDVWVIAQRRSLEPVTLPSSKI